MTDNPGEGVRLGGASFAPTGTGRPNGDESVQYAECLGSYRVVVDDYNPCPDCTVSDRASYVHWVLTEHEEAVAKLTKDLIERLSYLP